MVVEWITLAVCPRGHGDRTIAAAFREIRRFPPKTCDFCVATQLLRSSVMDDQVLVRRPPMFLRTVMVAAALAMAVPALAQDEQAAPERQAVPRGSRPQGDNPRTGTAVPRRESPPPATAPPTAAPAVRNRTEQRARTGPVNRGNTVIVNPPPIYTNRYYYYPRRSYPYGYGA